MKKVTAFLLLAMMCIGLIGCSGNSQGSSVSKLQPSPAATAQPDNIMEISEKARAYYSECIETIRGNQGKVHVTTAEIAAVLEGLLKECTEPTTEKSKKALAELERQYKSCKNHIVLSDQEKEWDYIYYILRMSHDTFAALTGNPKRY